MYCNCLSQAALQKYMAEYYETRWDPDGKNPLILWDVVHRFLPQLDISQTNWPDLIALFCGLSVIIRFYVLPGPRSMRFTIFKRNLVLGGILYGFRAFSIVST